MRFGTWMFALLALVACSNEGKLPFSDDTLLGSGGSSGGSGLDGSSGSGGNKLAKSCWYEQGDCNPVSNSGCSSEEACDLTDSDLLVCYDPPNTQYEGDYCDNANGPYCAGGLRCHDYVCRPFCCDEDDCDGYACLALEPDLGTLGVCEYY